jgi:plasmid stabilization system protein ParE
MAEFRVVLSPEAERNIDGFLRRLIERSPQGANHWYRALLKAIARLTSGAASSPLAPESRHFDVEIRDLVFKTRRGLPYRILFTIDGSNVYILYVRGPGQDLIQ